MTTEFSKSAGLATRLRIAREQAGLSQGQVAKMLNLHRPTISEIEAGRRKVTAEELSTFADIYGVSLSWLLEGQNDNQDAYEAKVELAARELANLKPEDLQRLLDLLKTLREQEK